MSNASNETETDPGSETETESTAETEAGTVTGTEPVTATEAASGVGFDDGPVTDAGARIYPLVADDGNQRVLRQWLERHDHYEAADTTVSVSEASFDLCVVDENSLRAHREVLKRRKADSPVMLPVLLLLPETRGDVIEIDGGEIADNVFATTVDEIVSLPIQQAELGWRIQALLRLRSQSANLSARTTKLRLFRQAVEDAGQAVAITTPAAEIEYVNAAFEAATGYEEATVLGRAWWQIYDEPTTEEYRGAIEATLATGAVWRGELPVQRADGERIDTRQTLSPVFDDDNEVQAYVATLQDITDRKRRQDELRQYKRAIVGASDLIAAVDCDGTYLFANPNYKEYHGIDADSVTGLALDDVLNGQRHPRMRRNRERALAGESVSYRTERDHPTRGTRVLDVRYYPIEEAGAVTGVVAVLQDVTDREDQAHQLQVVDRVLRHNLRNDLSVVQMHAERINEQGAEPGTEIAAEMLEHIDQLLTTSEKSRDITQVLSDRSRPAPVDLGEIVATAGAAATERYPAAEIEIEGPKSIAAFATENIDRAIDELLTNAVVHSDQSSPLVRVTTEADSETVVVTVTDDGPGLPAVERDVLEQGTEIDDLYHGSGLGLWLVHWIVRRSGGSVTVADAEPTGTAVTVSLPRHGGE